MRRQLLGVLLCFTLVGCSAKEQIYNGAHKASQLANSSRDSAIEIQEISTQPEVVTLAGEIISEQEEILEVAEEIKEATTRVKDIESKWERLAKLVFGAVAIVAAVYFTWVYVVPIRALVGRFIPRRRAEASLLRKVLKGDAEVTEFGSRWRADPANEGAYQSIKKKEALRGR